VRISITSTFLEPFAIQFHSSERFPTPMPMSSCVRQWQPPSPMHQRRPLISSRTDSACSFMAVYHRTDIPDWIFGSYYGRENVPLHVLISVVHLELDDWCLMSDLWTREPIHVDLVHRSVDLYSMEFSLEK
jgi:hypothetical protein